MVQNLKKIPETAGVYLMKNAKSEILYIGKAANLRKRIKSYFERPHDYRIQKLVSEIGKIDFKKTETVIEALILESKLIKKFQPPFNIREKDGKTFLYVEIIDEEFPRVLLVRGGVKRASFGPFVSASSIREALRILRRIFPFNLHEPEKIGKSKKPCFDFQIGLCPGTCIGAVNKKDYLKNIKNLRLIFEGKKNKLLEVLDSEMKLAIKKLDFEKAEKLKRRIFALRHIQDVSLIKEEDDQSPPYRIEGYDISNISGTSAVGSMVVFFGNNPAKSEYRKFKIKTFLKPNDTGMLAEIIRRRFQNNWPFPDLILIDGGEGQTNSAGKVLAEFGLKIPVVGIAKGAKRKNNRIVGFKPDWVALKTLISVRDEAHRFAVSYHKKIRFVFSAK